MYKTTIVTCLFDCHKDIPFDAKNYYHRKSLRTMAVEQPMVIFCNPENEKFFTLVREALGLGHLTKVVTMSIDEFPMAKYREELATRYRHSYIPKSDTPDIYIVWMSKYEMLGKAMELNPFNTSHFAWMDVNMLTKIINGSLNYLQDDVYEMIDQICKKPKEKCAVQILNYWHPSDYENPANFYREYRWIVVGCFVTIPKELIPFIQEKFRERAIEMAKLGFCQGDESVYSYLIDNFKNFFSLGVADYQDTLHNYFFPKSNIHYVNNVLAKFKEYRNDLFQKIVEDYRKSRDLV